MLVEPHQSRPVLRLDNGQHIRVHGLNDTARVLGTDLVDGLSLEIDPPRPIAGAAGHDLDRFAAGTLQQPSPVLTQDDELAFVDLLEAEIGEQADDLLLVGRRIDFLAQKGVQCRVAFQYRLAVQPPRFVG